MSIIRLEQGNRILRVGFGQYSGRWFFRIDLWFIGIRLAKQIKSEQRGGKHHAGVEVCSALGLNGDEVTDLSIDVYPGYLRVNASSILHKEKVVNRIIKVLKDTKDAG